MAGMLLSPSSLPYNVNRTPTVCSSRYLKSSPTFSSHSKCNLTPRNPWISGAVNSSNVQLQLVNSFACKPYSCPRFPFAHRGRFVQVGFANPQNPLVNGGALDNAVGSEEQGWRNKLEQIGDILSTAFPLWVALACVAGLVRPTAFLWIRGNWQIGGLTLTMLGMGMTLTLKDLQGALAMPKELLGGVMLQYTVMPIAGALVSRLLRLPSHYAAGLILLACCPGGTASNVVTYLARGNVALSVLMTAFSTFLAVVMTPLLTAKLAGQYVAVDAGGLFASTVQVVLLPVLIGALMNQYSPSIVSRISPFTPLVAVVAVSALCASAIAQNASAILSSGGQVVLAVCSLHVAGFFFGYLLSRFLGFDGTTSRTISIEVGMQNSVLGVVLAGKHFSNPLTAVPCAVSSVCQSIFGSALAGFWRLTSSKEIKD